MALSALSKSIHAKAEEEQQRIERIYEREVAELEQEHEERVSRFKRNLDEYYQQEVRAKTQNILGKYKSQAKQEVLKAQGEILDSCYQEVLETLRQLRGEERQQLFKRFVERARQTMDFDEIYCSRSDARWVKPLVSEEVKLRRDDSQDGLYFVAKDGREVLDMNFEPVLRECFDRISDELQELLFKQK